MDYSLIATILPSEVVGLIGGFLTFAWALVQFLGHPYREYLLLRAFVTATILLAGTEIVLAFLRSTGPGFIAAAFALLLLLWSGPAILGARRRKGATPTVSLPVASAALVLGALTLAQAILAIEGH